MTLALASAGVAQAQVVRGVEAWERGDYTSAVREWQALAERGDADAQFNLGQAYKLGRGVPQDLTRAAELFGRAAAQNHLQAADNLGLVLYDLGRRDEAMPHLMRSADRGEPRAQFVLGAELFNGVRMSRDWPRAYALMKRSADQGLERATAAMTQMDAAIPIEQRRRGLELAREMERSEQRARLAAVAPPPSTPAPRSPGATATPPLRPGPATPAPNVRTPAASREAAAVVPPRAPSRPETSPPARPASPPATSTSRAAAPAAATAANGRFWIQLGAFSSRDRAESAWSAMRERTAGAGPRYVAAGNVVRLQAGPYATRAAAQSGCTRAGNGCFVVSP